MATEIDTQTLVFFKTNDEGKKVKITRTIKLEYIPAKVTDERKSWPKYQHGEKLVAVPENGEPVTIRLAPKAVATAEPPKKIIAPKTICRNCGGPHLFSRCTVENKKAPINALPTAKAGVYNPPNRRGGLDQQVDPTLQRFLPSSARAGAHNDNEFSLRVTNIPLEITDQMLRQKFHRIPGINRIHLVKTKDRMESRGFAFVGFDSRESAEAGRAYIDGKSLLRNVVHAEFAQPKSQ